MSIFDPKTWTDRPSTLDPRPGEFPSTWFARIRAFAADNPGVLTPVDADGLNDLEDRIDTLSQSVVSRDRLALNVRDYGTLVNGAGDAVPGYLACLADAYDAIDGGDATGVDILVSRGTYDLQAVQTGGGQNWHVPVQRSGIRFVHEQGAVLTTSQDAALYFFGGCTLPGLATSWESYWLGKASLRTYYSFADAVLYRGAMQVTLATPADAANFAVGDAVHIRTGQTTNASVNDAEPDAEINEVASVDAGTGIIGLRWPLVKNYQQEWFVGASSGGLDGNHGKSDTTSRGGGNNGAVTFGIANVQAITQRNVGVQNLQFDAPSAGRYAVMSLGAVLGLTIDGASGRIGGSVMNTIEYRFGKFRNFDVQIVNSASASARWVTTTGTSCSDIEMENIRGVGKGGRMAMAHFHEGTANLRVRGYRLSTDAGLDDTTPYSIRARAYNQVHEDVEVAHGGSSVPVYVSPEAGDPFGLSELRNVRASCAGDATRGVRIDAAGWSVGRAHPSTPVRLSKPAAGYTIATTTPGATQPASRMDRWEAACWVTPTNATAILGQIPDNCTLTDAEIFVHEAVSGGGSSAPRLSVGWDGNEQAFVAKSSLANLDTTGQQAVSFSTTYYRVYQGPLLTQPRTLKAYLTWTGSTPANGKVRVSVSFRRDPEAP